MVSSRRAVDEACSLLLMFGCGLDELKERVGRQDKVPVTVPADAAIRRPTLDSRLRRVPGWCGSATAR